MYLSEPKMAHTLVICSCDQMIRWAHVLYWKKKNVKSSGKNKYTLTNVSRSRIYEKS